MLGRNLFCPTLPIGDFFRTVIEPEDARCPIDKNEGGVKGKDILSGVRAPLTLPELGV
jgi:hypothetical protein